MHAPTCPRAPNGMGSLEQKSSKDNRKNDERKTYDEIKIFFSFAGGSGLFKMTLLYHRSTSSLNTSVATKNGVVTLTGKAKSAAEMDLATKYVNDVNGVKSVKNQMTIE
jgi:hypothetical protein